MAEAVVIEPGAQSSPIEPKTAMLIIVAIVLVILLLLYYFYKKGQGDVKPSFANLQYTPGVTTQLSDPNPPPGSSTPQVTLTSYAQGIHADIPAYTAWYAEIVPYDFNTAIWNTLTQANLSDNDAKALYNTYNALFQQSSGKTLITDLLTGAQSTFASEGLKSTGVALANRLQSLTGQTS